MSEENTKLKVKDLPESERTELLLRMEQAGCRGIKTEYSVETAKAKVAEWQAKQNTEDCKNAGENGNGEQNVQNVNETPENVNETPENVNEMPENVNETAKNDKKTKKTLICHMCRRVVINGVCTGCGFTLKRG